MAKNKCAICGTKVKPGALRCVSCGIPQVDLNSLAKRRITGAKVNGVKSIDNKPLTERTIHIIERLDLFAKVIKVLAFFSLVALAIYTLLSRKWLLLLLCLSLYFVLPFIALPISWMQLMLENLFEIKNKLK